jgi:predicted dehydrogenase
MKGPRDKGTKGPKDTDLPTSELDLRLLTSDFRLPTSDLRPLSSVLTLTLTFTLTLLPPPLRFAVVGCGMLAQSQHLPNIVQSANAELESCVDIDEGALAACRERFRPRKTSRDFMTAIRDPEVDAICLATAGLRWPVIEMAAKAGKHMYIEKPLGSTLEEIHLIQRAVKAAGIKACVGHNRRSSPAMIDAHRIFRAHMERPQPCPWRFDREGAARPPQPDDRTAVMNVRINDDWYSWKAWALDPDRAPHGQMLWEMTHFTDLSGAAEAL